jgi:hypothetical protein
VTSAASFQPKLIYLTKRHPTLSREAFTRRWRQHGALGMSLPRWRNIARYVHCDVLRPQTPTADLDSGYDGVGLIWHRSPQARAAHVADTSSRLTMERDEAETFALPIVNSCLLAREVVLARRADAAGSSVKLTCFIKALPSSAAQTLVRSRIDMAAELSARIAAGPGLRGGYVINAPLPAPNAAGWGLEADCVEEWWFDDERSAVRVAPILRRACEGEIRIVLTNEVLLYAA